MSKPTDVPASTKMLPCPFCGGECEINPEMGTTTVLVSCENEGCSIQPVSLHMDSREDAIEAWNQRTPAASPVAPNESMGRPDPSNYVGDGAGQDYIEVLHAQMDALEAKLASPVAGGSAENGLHDVVVGDPVWAMQNSDGTIRLALDCGDGGFIKMTAAQAEQIRDTLNEFLMRPEGWVKVTPETMPPTGAKCLIVWSGQVQNALYRRAGIGYACAGGYEWRRADDDEADAIPDAEVEFWKPRPAPPAAEEERSSL